MPQNPACQVLVAGGGPAGIAAAIALAERRFQVVVVDPNHATPALSRCEMLPQTAQEILQRLGLTDVLEASIPLNGVVSLWGTEKPVNHAAAMPGLSRFGWSVDRRVLNSALHKRAQALGVVFKSGRVGKIQGKPGNWQVNLSDNKTQMAAYLIDATGRPAVVARRLGAKIEFGPDLVAVTCNVKHPIPTHLLAEARPDGWWYALPRSGNGGSIGYLTTGLPIEKTAAFMTQAAEDLKLVPTPVNGEDIYLSDSRMARLFPTTAKGWLATGDAAVAFDPIASQGLFNALSSGFFAGNAAADILAGDPESAFIYATLVERTASRSCRQIPHQYGTRPFDTSFWNTNR